MPEAPEVPTAKSTATIVKEKLTKTMLETNNNSTSSDEEETDFSFKIGWDRFRFQSIPVHVAAVIVVIHRK